MTTQAPEMEKGLQVFRKLYYGRRTVKDVAKALMKMTLDWDVTTKIYVIEDEGNSNASNSNALIVVRVACTADKADEIRGVLALGHPEVGNYTGVVDERDCLEFYQGRGLARFRGQ